MAYPNVAVDGQTLDDAQNAGAVGAFHTAYGTDAPMQWAMQHNAAIGFKGDPNQNYMTNGGVKTITDLGVELKHAGYPGPWDESSMVAAYGRASGVVPTRVTLPVAQSPNPPASSPTDKQQQTSTQTSTANANTKPTVAGLQVAGNPGQWLNQTTNVLGVTVPHTVILGAGVVGLALVMLQQSPRRR